MKISTDTRDRLLSLGFPIFLLLLWEFAAHVNWIDTRFFPAPSTILAALWGLVTNGNMLGKVWLLPRLVSEGKWDDVLNVFAQGDMWITLFRIFAGFLLGAIPGIILGVITGMNRSIRVAIDPLVSAIYVLPKIAIFPLIMLIFGLGETSKIITIGIASFFLIFVNTSVGVRDIDPIFFEAARNYGAKRWQMFWHVIIPGALPVIFAGLRLSLGTALIVIIAVEFVNAQHGLGYLVWLGWETLLTENMFAGLFVIMMLGVLFTSSLQFIEHRLMPWARDEHPTTPDTIDTSMRVG